MRVLDLATALAAPLAAGILAEQGADVIKIEPPGAGDVLRHVGAAIGGVSGIYQMTNRAKRAATVDITTAEGRAIVLELAAGADLVFQNFRPGVAERLGVSYEQLRRVNPDVIVVAVTGFGPTGPYADRPAYDGIIQAASGIAALEADAGTGEPHSLRHTVSDKLTALHAVQAATAALLARERGAGGQLVELAMLEVSASFLWIDAAGRETLLDYDGPQRSDPAAHVKPMACADGWMYIVALSDDQYAGLCRALGGGGGRALGDDGRAPSEPGPGSARLAGDPCPLGGLGCGGGMCPPRSPRRSAQPRRRGPRSARAPAAVPPGLLL